LVLSNSFYPSQFPQSFELEYTKDNKSLIVDYWLPSLDDMPEIKEVKFIKSRQELKPVAVSDAQRKRYFDSTIYQITLRTIHELFEADSADAIDMITFNGFVNHISKSTGKQESACIVSLQTSKEEFLEIDLSRVDPKECFKGLKGIGSSKLYGLTPIKPILKMDRNDSRISSHYSVVDDIDDSINLASMGWEDFEHLVRELFAKEFTGEGSEVHVTRASKDGGVDAIAFDPDPIRGGKIVIQAKRYTNTVGVAAVRDLYGTVMNEGAIKGILVTTSNYGPDAYSFAKNKPLALLNGSNLLHLLMNHGVEAKIDLKEAKRNK
jgi:restriction system protein